MKPKHLFISILITFTAGGAAAANSNAFQMTDPSYVAPTPPLLNLPLPTPVSPIVLPPNTAGETQIRFFAHGEDSLAARLKAVREAQVSIDLLTYIFEPCDSSSKILLDAIVDRASHGVKVRLIVDQYAISQEPAILNGLAAYIAKINSRLAHPIDFRLYEHPDYGFFNPEAPNNRSHIKMLLIDPTGRNPMAFIGGRNNSDGYFGLSKAMNYFDQDLMITGTKTAQKVLRGFNTVLKYASFSTPDPAGATASSFAATCLKRSARDAEVEAAIDAKAENILQPEVSKIYSCSKIYFDMDDPQYRLGYLGGMVGNDDLANDRLAFKNSTALMLEFIAGTKSVLHITNQYYIPIAKIYNALAAVRDAGKSVTVLTNLTGDADGADLNARMTGLITDAIHRDSVKNTRVLGLSSRGGLHDEGALRINSAPWRIHTKTAVRDHKDVLVSSFNLDSRSYQLNAEDAVMVADCPDLAHDMELEYQKLVDIYQADLPSAMYRSEQASVLRALPLSPPADGSFFDFFF